MKASAPSLKECEKCGAKVSENAEYCPKCNQDLGDYFFCKTCKEKLYYREQRGYSEHVKKGTTRSIAYMKPCPECGETSPASGKDAFKKAPITITYLCALPFILFLLGYCAMH